MPTSLVLTPRRFARHDWAPMTDAEWAGLATLVAPAQGAAGRRPVDPRRLWDAIFWVACSSGPWREMPEALGKPGTVHRALCRHARAGLLDRLLVGLSSPALATRLGSLAWRIARAWRRVARLMRLGQLLMAKRLGLLSALPCAPDFLPRPDLSERAMLYGRILFRGPWNRPLHRYLRLLLRMMAGDRRQWRLTD
ncbi:transposase [Falsiroseomonas sp. HW251]|uniref:transposase n=1 Tax=Falsiroseomonas sp. HW251 TaxID=3390998 RepID=UPI003D3154F4